jgi:hypothetical protein
MKQVTLTEQNINHHCVNIDGSISAIVSFTDGLGVQPHMKRKIAEMVRSYLATELNRQVLMEDSAAAHDQYIHSLS